MFKRAGEVMNPTSFVQSVGKCELSLECFVLPDVLPDVDVPSLGPSHAPGLGRLREPGMTLLGGSSVQPRV